jgi:hypothetical protein
MNECYEDTKEKESGVYVMDGTIFQLFVELIPSLQCVYAV